MSDWDKLRRLSGTDRRLLARAAVMLAHAKLTLRNDALRADPDAPSPGGRADAAIRRAQEIARLVGIASSRLPLRTACLHRSVVLWRLLRREGIACELRLGAKSSAGPFEAHAWVECRGVALGETDAILARYRPFSRAVAPVGRRHAPRKALRRAP